MTNDKFQTLITRDLGTQIFGRRVIYHERVGSTNDIAKQLADAGEPEGAVVIADEQIAGRGRLGRSWVAPAGSSILMSLILRPMIAPAQMPRVTMAVALGACDAIHAKTHLDAQIKWPNDILVRGKKCAGILAESGIVGEQLEYVIVGLGLNVNFAASSVEGIPPDATTIADELGRAFPRAQLAQAILRNGERYYLRLSAGENLRDEWAARLATLHQPVRAQTPWGVEEGIAENVDDDGALLVRRADGSCARLIAGDVTLAARKKL
ncbi:BirA family transcriptional regulator, biotin operon repressor / biotin---[acetyl-CoA-carboxylase] ligase [Anaerolineae bacterium]|nr:BirA family transcriptional regulator, biotin operon repressor / biotin---[acetyl-CoA-carboxylase] ligase [Anaerolineae bacterium]